MSLFVSRKEETGFYFHPKMVELIVDLGNFSAEAFHSISFGFFAGSSMATSPVPCRMVILLRPGLSMDPRRSCVLLLGQAKSVHFVMIPEPDMKVGTAMRAMRWPDID